KVAGISTAQHARRYFQTVRVLLTAATGRAGFVNPDISQRGRTYATLQELSGPVLFPESTRSKC
ncbi:MAG: hypothetical protein OQK67_08845, partial [Chlorobium sp.]|nr:hypothetical protein [Chlorobium sp.]